MPTLNRSRIRFVDCSSRYCRTGTFRFTYMLATHKRDELSRDWRGDEMEKLVKAARELQDLLQGTESR